MMNLLWMKERGKHVISISCCGTQHTQTAHSGHRRNGSATSNMGELLLDFGEGVGDFGDLNDDAELFT